MTSPKSFFYKGKEISIDDNTDPEILKELNLQAFRLEKAGIASPKLSEDLELIKFFDWVSWHKKLDPRLEAIIHVANERRTSYTQGKVLKQKGVKSGVFDVICFVPTVEYHGLIVELKIKPNKLSKTQIEFGRLLHALGWCVRVAWSGDELIQIVKEYLEEKDYLNRIIYKKAT